jgi:diguanylate cyclase (GGDEF)-like protein
MNPSSWFRSGDAEQRVRLRRYLIAAGTSLMLVALLFCYFVEGVLPARPFATASGVTLTAIVVFYVLLRSGWNKKARDPSLTIPMMMVATCVVSYALYHLGPHRTSLLLLYPVIMFFGVFRLNTRALLLICLFMLACYALVVALLLHGTLRVDHPDIEILEAAVFAVVLIWFSFMGGYVYELRRRVRRSEYDELTRSYSRRRILEILANEKIRCDRGAGPLSVCMVDIDRFKGINDAFGHHMGDLVLQTFVKVARGELRTIDAIGRYGGEEFLLLLVQTPLEGARECAERVRQHTQAAEYESTGDRCQVTVSIGVAQYRPPEDVSDTLRRADAALYRAKRAGRNRVELE